MKTILTVRREAGSDRGIEYARRLETMPPADAADELFDMYMLCADEDLPYEMRNELGVRFSAAENIGAEIVRKRYAHVEEFARLSTAEIVGRIREFNAQVESLPLPKWDLADFDQHQDAYMRLRSKFLPLSHFGDDDDSWTWVLPPPRTY